MTPLEKITNQLIAVGLATPFLIILICYLVSKIYPKMVSAVAMILVVIYFAILVYLGMKQSTEQERQYSSH